MNFLQLTMAQARRWFADLDRIDPKGAEARARARAEGAARAATTTTTTTTTTKGKTK